MTGVTRAILGAQGAAGGATQEAGRAKGGGEQGAQGDTGAGAVDPGRDITRYRAPQGVDMAMARRGDTLGTGSGPSQLPRGAGGIGAGQRTRGRWRAGGRGSGGP